MSLPVRPIHRLEIEVSEVQVFVLLWLSTFLRIDKFQLVALSQSQLSASLRAYTNPVDSRRRKLRPIGFDCNVKSPFMEQTHEFHV